MKVLKPNANRIFGDYFVQDIQSQLFGQLDIQIHFTANLS